AQSPHEFIMLDDLLAQILQRELMEQAQKALMEQAQKALMEQAAKEQRGLLRKAVDRAARLASKEKGRGTRPTVDPAPQEDEHKNRLESLVRNERIDVVWFMTPLSEPLPIPYFATVWDLEHRKQPYFPEVSTTGWTWDARESAFGALLPRASMVI